MTTARLFGVLNINKPRAMTSHDVVQRVRRLIGEKRVGHGGTLDPDATGVLPVLVGNATKLSKFVLDMDKTYEAEMTLGTVTDTQDATGNIVSTSTNCQIGTEHLSTALSQFVGHIMQIPPMVSAIKIGGKRLYELARSGVETPRDARPVRIDSLVVKEIHGVSEGMLKFGSRIVIVVTCSKGTYIRTLCHDIGQTLGCGAHMSALKRLSVGPFALETSVDLTTLEACHKAGNVNDILLPPETVLQDVARVVVSSDEARRLKSGQAIALQRDRFDRPFSGQADCGVIEEPSRELICIARFDQHSERLRPIRVF